MIDKNNLLQNFSLNTITYVNYLANKENKKYYLTFVKKGRNISFAVQQK